MARRGAFFGPVLIVVGLLMLLGQLGIPAFQHMWPLFLIIPGAAMLFRWFTARGDSGLVFSGTLLVLIGGLFQWDQWFWLDFGNHWPFFPLAVGLAFLARGIVDAEARESFVPGGILTGLAIIFYFFTSGLFSWLVDFFVDLITVVVRVAIPLGLIAWGAWMVFRRGDKPEPAPDFPEKIEPQPPVPVGTAAAMSPTPPDSADPPEPPEVVVPPAPVEDPGVVDADFEETTGEPDEDPDDDPPRTG